MTDAEMKELTHSDADDDAPPDVDHLDRPQFQALGGGGFRTMPQFNID